MNYPGSSEITLPDDVEGSSWLAGHGGVGGGAGNNSSENVIINASPPPFLLSDMATHPSHGPPTVNGVLFESPKGMWIIIDGIISLFAIFANLAFIGAIRSVKLDLKGYRIFLINLSIASMLSNLFSLFGMSIDHYIGIVHPLRYHQIMGKSRYIKAAVAAVWLISMLAALIDTLLLFLAYDASTRKNDISSSTVPASRDLPDVPDIMASLVKPPLDYAMMTKAIGIPKTTTAKTSPTINAGMKQLLLFSGTSGQTLMRNGDFPLAFIPILNSSNSSTDRGIDLPRSNRTGKNGHRIPTSFFTNAGNNDDGDDDNGGFLDGAESSFYNDAVNVVTDSKEINETIEKSPSFNSNMFPQAFWEGDVEDPVAHFMKMFISNDSETIAAYFDRILHNEEVYLVSWCSYYASETLWFELIVIGLTVFVFTFLVPIYYQTLRHMVKARVEQDWNAQKLVITTLFLLGAFLLCRVPFVLFEVGMVILMRIGYMRTNDSYLFTMLMNNALNSLLMFYPLMDPIIYTIRMRAVRRYLMWKIRKMMPERCQKYATSKSVNFNTSAAFTRGEENQVMLPLSRVDSTIMNCIEEHYNNNNNNNNNNGDVSNVIIHNDRPLNSSDNSRRRLYKAHKANSLQRPSFTPLTSYIASDSVVSGASDDYGSVERSRRTSSARAVTPVALTPQRKRSRKSSAQHFFLNLNRRLSLLLFDEQQPPPSPAVALTVHDVATNTSGSFMALSEIREVNNNNNNNQQVESAVTRWARLSSQRHRQLAAMTARIGHKRQSNAGNFLSLGSTRRFSKSTPDLSVQCQSDLQIDPMAIKAVQHFRVGLTKESTIDFTVVVTDETAVDNSNDQTLV